MARRDGAGDHRDPASRPRPSRPRPSRRSRPPAAVRITRSRRSTSAARKRLDPVAVDGRHREDRRPGEGRAAEQPPDLGDDLFGPPGAGDIGLGHDRDPVPDLERIEQRQVLDGLGARSVVGRHDQHRGIDLARPDEHVADQPVVPGDVDEVELGAVGQGEVGVADVDGHPAPALLGQPVGVDPGQGPQQRRLAVVDVAGGPDDDGHPASPPRALAR